MIECGGVARLLQSQYEALLAEPITDDEVRSLLERLGTAEFGGPEVSRVGDLIEATDADPQLMARLLGEIRHEDYQERFGARLDAVERRLHFVEGRVAPAPRINAPTTERWSKGRSQIRDTVGGRARR